MLVGDVNPSTVQRLATLYFGRYQSKTAVPPLNIIEPPQKEPKEVILKLPSQPWYLEGYRRPSRRDPDHVVYELMGRILSDGRTSRLYQSLVEQQKVSLAAQGFSGFPGDKYPNLMLFYSLTAPGKTVAEVAHSLDFGGVTLSFPGLRADADRRALHGGWYRHSSGLGCFRPEVGRGGGVSGPSLRRSGTAVS